MPHLHSSLAENSSTMAEGAAVLRLYRMDSTRMVEYSYRVLEKGGTWRWEMVGPEGEVLMHGTATTRVKAVAEAMAAWLVRVDTQGGTKDNGADGIRH
jgi:hypothetical protein